MGGFGIETTGEEPDRARIVAATRELVGAAHRPSHEFHLLIDPDVEVPAASRAVHGIMVEQDRAAAAYDVGTHLNWCVAFKGSYDFTGLDRKLSRHLDTGVAVTGPVVDPHIIDRTLEPPPR